MGHINFTALKSYIYRSLNDKSHSYFQYIKLLKLWNSRLAEPNLKNKTKVIISSLFDDCCLIYEMVIMKSELSNAA